MKIKVKSRQVRGQRTYSSWEELARDLVSLFGFEIMSVEE